MTSSQAPSGTSSGPALSIVIVAWNVAPYISQAIKSCYQLPEDQCEILVIENASSDHTLEEIRTAIAGRSNAQLVANDRNTGLGAARNQGIALARGKYVAFLDGDDWFAPDSLAAILAGTLREDADLTVFDYQRYWVNGTYSPPYCHDRLSEMAPTAVRNRRLATLTFHVAWTKFYRRAFLAENKFSFSDGYYEDLDWTYSILMSAPKVLRLPLVGVVYRQRQGSILNSMDPRHLAVIDRMHALALFMRQHPERVDRWWRRFLIRRMLRQIIVILRYRHRLDWAHKVKLAQAAGPVLAKFDPKNRFVPGRKDGRLIYRLLRRGHARLAVLAVRLFVEEPNRDSQT